MLGIKPRINSYLKCPLTYQSGRWPPGLCISLHLLQGPPGWRTLPPTLNSQSNYWAELSFSQLLWPLYNSVILATPVSWSVSWSSPPLSVFGSSPLFTPRSPHMAQDHVHFGLLQMSLALTMLSFLSTIKSLRLHT